MYSWIVFVTVNTNVKSIQEHATIFEKLKDPMMNLAKSGSIVDGLLSLLMSIACI